MFRRIPPFPSVSLLALPLVALLPAPAAARSGSDMELRLSASAERELGRGLVGNLSGQLRLADQLSHLSQARIGGGLEWELQPGVSASVDYAYMRLLPDGRTGYNGHRFSETIGYPLATIGSARLLGRTRLEQSFYDNGASPQHRFRQRLQLVVPLAGVAGLRAILEEEALLLLRRRGSDPAGLQQLRSFVGVGARLTGNLSLQAGYMNHLSFPGEDRVEHILDLRLSTGF